MIKLKNIRKSYGDKVIYDGFDLDIEEGVITAILGESGAGKTTLLNIIANLTEYSGEITGEISPVSMVFQKDRLVPHLTVEENLKLVNGNADVLQRLEEVGLSGSAKAYPKELSAGMSRRVALLRAFLYESPLLLMDEPLINLDLKIKYKLTELIKKLQKQDGRTIVTVTHDVKEAVLMADRVIVLKDGKVLFDENNVSENTERKLTEVLLQDN